MKMNASFAGLKARYSANGKFTIRKAKSTRKKLEIRKSGGSSVTYRQTDRQTDR